MSRTFQLEHYWYATLILYLVFSLTITGGASKGGQIFQTQLVVPPHEYKSFRFIASSEYEEISFQKRIISKIDNTSMFNWLLLNKSAYQNYRYHRSYTSIINDTRLRNEWTDSGYYYTINLPTGEYVYVLEHIFGTENLIIEIFIGLASSDEEMNELFATISRHPVYRTDLPSFLFIAVSTGGLLGILALKKINNRKSK